MAITETIKFDPLRFLLLICVLRGKYFLFVPLGQKAGVQGKLAAVNLAVDPGVLCAFITAANSSGVAPPKDCVLSPEQLQFWSAAVPF